MAYLRGGPLNGKVIRLPSDMAIFEVMKPAENLGLMRPSDKPLPVQIIRGRYVRQPRGTGLLGRLGTVYAFTGWYTLS